MSYLELKPSPERIALIRLSSGVVSPMYGRIGPGITGLGERPPEIHPESWEKALDSARRTTTSSFENGVIRTRSLSPAEQEKSAKEMAVMFEARRRGEAAGIKGKDPTSSLTWYRSSPGARCRPYGPISCCTCELCIPSAEDLAWAKAGCPPNNSGLGAGETPELRSLPWTKPRKPTERELRASTRRGRFQDVALAVGLLGGALGIYLSVKAIRGRR